MGRKQTNGNGPSGGGAPGGGVDDKAIRAFRNFLTRYFSSFGAADPAKAAKLEVVLEVELLGFRFLLARCSALAADHLSEKECRIALLAGGGLPHKEIGARCDVSKDTVATHLSRIFKKLGIDSKFQLSFLIRQPDLRIKGSQRKRSRRRKSARG